MDIASVSFLCVSPFVSPSGLSRFSRVCQIAFKSKFTFSHSHQLCWHLTLGGGVFNFVNLKWCYFSLLITPLNFLGVPLMNVLFNSTILFKVAIWDCILAKWNSQPKKRWTDSFQKVLGPAKDSCEKEGQTNSYGKQENSCRIIT